MHGLFGDIQISEEAHERRQNPARFRSVKSLDGLAELLWHRRDLRQTSKRIVSRQQRSLPYSQFSGPPLRLPSICKGKIDPRKRDRGLPDRPPSLLHDRVRPGRFADGGGTLQKTGRAACQTERSAESW